MKTTYANVQPTHTSCLVDYSTLVVIGAILALALLSGCASMSLGGASDPEQYNPNTGYPAVGSGHL